MTTHIHQISRAVFLGSKALGLAIFKALRERSANITWTIIHANDVHDPRSALSDFQEYARLYDIEFIVPSSVTETKKMLRDRGFGIGFVCGWYAILDSDALASVPHGLWGIHNSLLPKYRGSSPLVWSILNGDPIVGSSVFRLAEGMDSGDILLQVQVENSSTDDIRSILTKIEAALVVELPNRWSDLMSGQARLSSQVDQDATYCGQRSERDGLIDWNRSAWEVHNFIRAQSSPYPGAYSYLNREKVRVLKTSPLSLIYDGKPGQILQRKDSSIYVACGSRSALEIFDISIQGEQMPAAKGLHSTKLRFSDMATSLDDAG